LKETLHLLVDVTATGAPVDAVRPALSVVFVLDVSGSMLGEPLAQVVRSVSLLTELLSPTDKVGVVVFSHEASVVCPLRVLDTDVRRSLQRRLASLRAGGGTNIEAGLRAATTMLGTRTPHERQVVLLLSDGQPNAGAATADALGAIAASMREYISLSTLGFGASHDADVLTTISKRGGGQYWFIAEPDRAGVEFARALGAQSDIVADGIEVVFSPLDDVEVMGVVGEIVRFTREGPAVALPDLRAHQTRLTVAELVVHAPREPRRVELIDVVIRFRVAGHSSVQTIRQRVGVDVVDRPPTLVLEAHHAAQMARAELARTQARQAADRGNWEQAAAIVRRCIAELEQIPGYRLADGSPLSECVEQLFDEASEYEQAPSIERYAKFKATQLGIDVAQGAGHVADVGAESARSAALMQAALGPALPGHVVKIDAAGRDVVRYPLVAEMVVGRAPDNAIAIHSRSLSRRHSRFSCRNGRLLIDDLGSTNGTMVNGERVDAEHELHHGDLVMIGDATFRIELPPRATRTRA
jgi:Ca-activated chloride channel family protein